MNRNDDEEVARLRAAGIHVPESMEEAMGLIREAEEDPRPPIPIDEAFKNIREKLAEKRKFKESA